MMDSIEEMSGTTTDNNFDYSSSGKALHMSQNYIISSHGSQNRPPKRLAPEHDELSSDMLTPQIDQQLCGGESSLEASEEQVTFSQSEIQRLKKFVSQQENLMQR